MSMSDEERARKRRKVRMGGRGGSYIAFGV